MAKSLDVTSPAQLSGLFLTLAPPPLASRAQAGEVPPAGKSTLTLAQRHFAPSSVNSSKHSQLPKLIRYRLAKSEIRYLKKKLLSKRSIQKRSRWVKKMVTAGFAGGDHHLRTAQHLIRSRSRNSTPPLSRELQ